MHIVHMTSVHPWDDNRIFNQMCRTLALQGNDVHLVAVMDNNQDGMIIDGVTLHAINKPENRRERFLKTAPAVLAKAIVLMAICIIFMILNFCFILINSVLQ